MFTMLVLSTIVVIAATFVVVLKRAYRLSASASDPPLHPPPCPVARSGARDRILSLLAHLVVPVMAIACGTFVLRKLNSNELFPVLDNFLLFGSLRAHIGLVAVLAVIPTVPFITLRRQVRGEVIEADTPSDVRVRLKAHDPTRPSPARPWP
ncbi:uncharacterized protein EV420DRAFT_1126288 [Desarmillaria tabescens]|uniref:Uncharacterized protein n=1 Tax=Armillaria tabescens TaxID=1929756 RepID=A0AA39JF38_ARMTA|nr:uncharacterized protein EV420DRAFT_1126288 [Desarmillaria tabescens]KAK0440922.1 hypothetical protein EV420DRAFT_1126288 [Desarmillaria tabescens]